MPSPMKLITSLGIMALAVAAVGARQAIPQATGANVARDLRGAIDIHVHGHPDNVPRRSMASRPRGSRKTKGCARSC